MVSAIRLFISSVQKEFSVERIALRDYSRGDVLMKRFFDRFLLEDSLYLRLLNKSKFDATIERAGPRKGGQWEVLK
jgi:hypothetical protein